MKLFKITIGTKIGHKFFIEAENEKEAVFKALDKVDKEEILERISIYKVCEMGDIDFK